MKIGPVDIRNHTFTRKMRGVDEHEVRDYLDLVADRLEEAVLENDELRARIDQLEHEVRDHRALERSLRDSMLSAERLVDDRSAQAEKEAQIVIKNAEVQAGKILLQAREELGRLKAELDDLRRQKVTYVERFRALLRSQGKILEASLESFDPDAVLDEDLRHPAAAAAERPISPAPRPMSPAVPEASAPAPVPEPVKPASPAPPEPPIASDPPAPDRAAAPSSRPEPYPGSMSSYVTRSAAVPSPPPTPPAVRSDPASAAPPASAGPDSTARLVSPWPPSGSARESLAPSSGQERLFGGENA